METFSEVLEQISNVLVRKAMAKCCQVRFRDGDVALGEAWFCKGIALVCEGKALFGKGKALIVELGKGKVRLGGTRRCKGKALFSKGEA